MPLHPLVHWCQIRRDIVPTATQFLLNNDADALSMMSHPYDPSVPPQTIFSPPQTHGLPLIPPPQYVPFVA